MYELINLIVCIFLTMFFGLIASLFMLISFNKQQIWESYYSKLFKEKDENARS